MCKTSKQNWLLPLNFHFYYTKNWELAALVRFFSNTNLCLFLLPGKKIENRLAETEEDLLPFFLAVAFFPDLSSELLPSQPFSLTLRHLYFIKGIMYLTICLNTFSHLSDFDTLSCLTLKVDKIPFLFFWTTLVEA